jgi:3-hydroxy-9,10-secoandrosta-1,3,5(10)-triene-9,17-dione monooxygenase
VSAAICGFAQGAIDIYIDQMKVRKLAANASIGVAASPYVRDRLANAVARVRSCRARLMQLMAESLPIVMRRELVPEEMRVEHILDISRVGRECAEAVLLLFPAMGARGIYLDNPMQRVVRDVLAAAQHMTQNADDSCGLIGSRLLGTELPPTAYGVKRGPPAAKAAAAAA